MSMGVEVAVFLAYAFGMLMIYVFGRFLLAPLKFTGICLLNSVAGGVVIMLINCVGAAAGLLIPLNIVTAAVAGLLGIPGVIMLVLLFM